ncbi:MAG: UDP-N-acetylglucosamine 2-epimerase [Tissierellia bacterium]|nr:UDP-N-acetylglucosamine 2-epimerase [Tissierellia bacterium]
MDRKKILFLTGTRADYGKMKPLVCSIEGHEQFECHIFVTGMHTLREFGDTRTEIVKDGFKNIHTYMNQIIEEPMDLILANTINGFSRYIREIKPDMIIIHGDRVEALAGAIVGALNNILVAHIEGGEVSGTIDESIRHSVSKLAHIHFVSNEKAKQRLIQLGENKSSIYVIGSPDIDILMQKTCREFEIIKKHYEIDFDNYAVLLYHPVTTEVKFSRSKVHHLVDAIFESNDNFIVINPNNDYGYRVILDEYERFKGYYKVRRFPSIRFEYFVEILRNANYLIGNSSSGIHEAPVIGIPSINIGTRQNRRFTYESIINCSDNKKDILVAINKANEMKSIAKTNFFGEGKSRENFLKVMLSGNIWKTKKQKSFIDIG